MSTYKDKTLKSIADSVTKVMDEELKGKQHKIDKNKNNKIDSHDFEILRGEKKMKEEVESVDEASMNVAKLPTEKKTGNVTYTGHDITKTSTGTVYTKRPSDKISKKPDFNTDAIRSPAEKKLTNIERMKKGVKIGEEMKSFTSMLESYKEKGLKSLSDMISIQEEPTEDEFNAELEVAKEKSVGKNKAKVGAAAVQAVQTEEAKKCPECGKVHEDECEEEMNEELKGDMHPDAHKVLKHIQPQHHSVYKPFLKKGTYNGSYKDRASVLSAAEKAGHAVREEVEQIEERALTEPEMAKREEVVKSMKKKMSGFKDRYGDRAKEVMYATATKIAKKD